MGCRGTLPKVRVFALSGAASFVACMRAMWQQQDGQTRFVQTQCHDSKAAPEEQFSATSSED